MRFTALNIIHCSNPSHFRNLKDPRVERTRDHKLIDVIARAILAVMSGASGWQGMEDYGKSKQQWERAISGITQGNSLR